MGDVHRDGAGSGPEPTGDPAALEVALAEFRHVSALGPMYRQLEQRLLAALGVVSAGVGSVAVAILQPGLTPPRLGAVAALTTLAAWVVVLFLSLEITFAFRLLRANRYLRDVLYPRLDALAPGHGLAWETTPSLDLIGRRGGPPGTPFRRRLARLDDRARLTFVTSSPAIAALTAAAVGAVALAGALWITAALPSALTAIGMLLAGSAGVAAILLGFWGFRMNVHVDRGHGSGTTTERSGGPHLP